MTKLRTNLLALLIAVACHVPAFAQGDDAPAIERDAETRTVRVRLERGGKVELDNRTTGRIVVHGWDRDYIEAVATSERGTEHVRASSVRDSSGHKKVFLTADYLPSMRYIEKIPMIPMPRTRDSVLGPEARPSMRPDVQDKQSPMPSDADKERDRFFDRRGEVHLEVKLPRYAELELISVNRSEVEVSDIETPVTVDGNRSAIKLNRVGAVEVRTGSGAVVVLGASGLVDVTTESGDVRVRDVRGDVRVLSLRGDVRTTCVRGRVNVNNTGGAVALQGIRGDADATTVNGDIYFNGALRPEGRYHLKSMSGAVEMLLGPDPPGFTALLSSYRGQIENGFSLKRVGGEKDPKQNTSNNRLLGRHGNGQAQITLDSFDGKVKLDRAAPGTTQECKQ